MRGEYLSIQRGEKVSNQIRFRIFGRRRSEINTDPQRRCYYGVHARSEYVWSEWYSLGVTDSEDEAIKSVASWKQCNNKGDHDYKYESELKPD